jgi:hypothetical protein
MYYYHKGTSYISKTLNICKLKIYRATKKTLPSVKLKLYRKRSGVDTGYRMFGKFLNKCIVI